MQRTLADARARVPQFESLIRSRDEQIKRLKEELKEKDVRINGLVDDVREAEFALKDKDRELKEFTARHETLPVAGHSSAGSGMGDVLMGDETLEISLDASLGDAAADAGSESQLRDRIAELEAELRTAHSQAADAMAEAAAAEAEVITLKAELARASGSGSVAEDERGDSQSIADLEARLTRKSEEHDRLARALESEQRRVMELERERELQNKSLRVLHQQLELEKERGQRAAAG
jgi:structural maintenance of chromosome 2